MDQHLGEYLGIEADWSLDGDPADTVEVISPHTEQPIARVAAAGPAEVDAAVAAARAAIGHGPWPRLDPAERIAAVRRLAEAYAGRRGEMAQLISAEMGAPITFAQRAQVGLPTMMMSAFSDLAETYPWQETRTGFFGSDIRIQKQPVGVVAAIVPWNMPQFLIVTKLVPALLAGCAVVLKPAPESPLDAVLLSDMLKEIGLPEGVVSVVQGDAAAGARLVVEPVMANGSPDGDAETACAALGTALANA